MKIPAKLKSQVIEAKEKIAFLEHAQFELYDEMCQKLKTQDKEGWLWDYLFNDLYQIDGVIGNLEEEKSKK